MIIDLGKFSRKRRKYWEQLEKILESLEKNPERAMDIEEVKRFHYLYQAASADLARITTFSADPGLKIYLENLVARAYGEIHENRGRRGHFSFKRFLFDQFPSVFRKHVRFFQAALAVMVAGCLFGGAAVVLDPDAKSALMPFPHLQIDPSKRVEIEESEKRDDIGSQKAAFSSYLMTHNIRVTIFVLALGITWGVGTVAVLFANGVMLGAVIADYIAAGESAFLVGWLLPHGAVEIPAILLGGQAGLLLAAALIGWGRRAGVRERLRDISPDLTVIVFGAAALLVWAGIVEAFFSQYHEPVIPYEVKIGFGIAETGLLIFFLSRSGKKKADSRNKRAGNETGRNESRSFSAIDDRNPTKQS